MHPDDLLRRHSPVPLVHWIDAAIPVIGPDDGYPIGRALKDLTDQVLSLLALGNLKPEPLIGVGKLRCPLRNSFLKIVTRSRNHRHQYCEDHKCEVIESEGNSTHPGLEGVADNRRQNRGNNASPRAAIPKGDRDCG